MITSTPVTLRRTTYVDSIDHDSLHRLMYYSLIITDNGGIVDKCFQYYFQWCQGFLNGLAILVMAVGELVGSVYKVFCKEFDEIRASNPFERCITITSAVNVFYRTTHMQERTRSSEPVNGWHLQGKPPLFRVPGMVHLLES